MNGTTPSLFWSGKFLHTTVFLTRYGDIHGSCSPGIHHLTREDATYNGSEVGADNGEYIGVGGGCSACQGLHKVVC